MNMNATTISMEKDGAAVVRIINGAWDGHFNIAGKPVSMILAALADSFSIRLKPLAFVNGSQVDMSYRLQANDHLEFTQSRGEKGILDPDEKAQLERIEAMLSRLFNDIPKARKRAAAATGSPGRKTETQEIAVYANELRLQRKTWKEVFSACRKRWPNDRRVRNSRQIRATWDRHFGSDQNQH